MSPALAKAFASSKTPMAMMAVRNLFIRFSLVVLVTCRRSVEDPDRTPFAARNGFRRRKSFGPCLHDAVIWCKNKVARWYQFGIDLVSIGETDPTLGVRFPA